MKRILASVGFLALLLACNLAFADTTLHFTNNEVNLGTASQIDLTTQYAAFGLTFTNAYRYIDSRDPFSDAPNQVSGANLGISNGLLENNTVPAQVGRVDFTGGTNFVTFDWWTIGSNPMTVDFFNSSNVLLSSASLGTGSGTFTFGSPFAYLEFHDGGGFVQIANMTYTGVPEPGSMLLLASGVAGLVGRLRRKA